MVHQVMNMVSKSDLEILNQLIDDETATYRLRAGQRVHYLTVSTDMFDEDTLCRPYLLIPKLPGIPDGPWTTMVISRDNTGSLETTISTDALPGVQTTWHAQRVDVLSLKKTKRFRSGVHEVLCNGGPAVAKVTCFEWDLRRIENETWAYSILARHQKHHPDEDPIVPAFLGHLTENGRVIGVLVEKVSGTYASIDDLTSCEALVRKFHRLGLIHGDINRYNFLVDRTVSDGCCVRLVDFEHAEEFDEELARMELLSLPSELVEETGRGSTVVR